MSASRLRLTALFGERDRAGGRFLAEALMDALARHDLEVAVLLRGAEGFGARHLRRTDRQLTLSEDLPLVALAVGAGAPARAAAAQLRALPFEGLVTLEPVLDAPAGPTLLTIHLGRHDRAGGRAAHRVAVELLREAGVAGASVLLGVDGVRAGTRHRAAFWAANADVPLLVVSVGDAASVAVALPRLRARLGDVQLTLSGVRLCKRDGRTLAPLDASAAPLRRLTLYAGEQSRHAGHALSPRLVRALREAGAAGATSLRGIWGYHGDHAPHGDSFRSLRRRVPVLTTLLDTPERIERLWPIVDAFTDETGLVTLEDVAEVVR